LLSSQTKKLTKTLVKTRIHIKPSNKYKTIKLIKISSLLTFDILLNSCASVNKKANPVTKNLFAGTPKVSITEKYINSTHESWNQYYYKFKRRGKS
jgi:hypothetical protein